jgi:hypothetical protein
MSAPLRRRGRGNPGKMGWFAIGTAVGIGVTVAGGAAYVFWRLTKL